MSASNYIVNAFDTSANTVKNYSWSFNWEEENKVTHVGIGTNNPIRTLDVNGDLNLSGNLYQNYQGKGLWTISNSNDISYTDICNIGIGKTAPSYKLDVNGTVRANSYVTMSDERYKKNIKDEILGLDYLKTLKPRTFNFKDDKSHTVKHGFIAQEINNLDFISKDENNILSINSSYLIAPIIKSLQEISTEHENLKQKLIELNSR